MSARLTGRSLYQRWLLPALAALALMLVLGPALPAEAATFRNHVVRVPDVPTSPQTVRVWMNSDTALGEDAGLEYNIVGTGTYVKVLGTYDTSGPAPANWRADIPAFANGTEIRYQLFTRNEFGSDYGFTGFNWSYIVFDGDIQWDGLKHDTFDGYYRNPFGAVPADTDVMLRFRTVPLDVDGVTLVVYTYNPATGTTSGPIEHPLTYLEDKVENSVNYAIWTVTLDTPNTPAVVYYKFKVTDRLDVDWYSDQHGGAHDNLNQGGVGATFDGEPFDSFQLTVYDPAFETPEWLQNASVYQIFPDRFRNGDLTNDYCISGSTAGCPLFYGDQDILPRSPWNSEIGNPRVAGPYFNEYGTQFYGGDLQGLIDKLDYLQSIGIDTLYLTPIFDGQSNHRYDTDDYLAIDPALGTMSDFQELTAELDARGMYLILDGVFNHTSSDSLYFDRYGRYPGADGACESLASSYRPWYEFLNSDVPCGAGDYAGWFGYDSLAVLTDDNANVRDFIYRDENSVVDYWYEQGAHGWRFDVADEISHDWWRDFRPYAKTHDADGPLVGEVWPDASNFLLGDQLDSVMNYRFRKNVLGFVRQAGWADNDNNGNNEIIALSPSQFDRALKSVREDYPPQATAAMLNLLDSHDTNRALYTLTLLGDSGLTEARQRLALAALFQFTYVGAPMVYYGDEIALNSPSQANGVNGPEDDPYNRAPYPWADEVGDTSVYGPADANVLDAYSTLGNLRRNREALRTGEFVTLLTGDTTASSSDNTTYAFARVGADETAVVALNPGGGNNTAVVPVGSYYANGSVLEDKLTGALLTVSGGNVSLALPARSGAVLLPVLPASLTVSKTIDGAAPGADWSFSGTLGVFTLPAGGGSTFFSNQAPGDYTIEETDLAGWVPSVYCSPGETGASSVTLTLSEGEAAVCTFINTQCQPGSYDNGVACTFAQPGYFVPTAGASAATACALGYFQPNSGAILCNPATPGHYVDSLAAIAQAECSPGYYQPAAAAVQCIAADPGYYVPTPAATEQTPCPTGTTSGMAATECTPIPDATAPETTIDTAPDALTNDNDPSFTFSSNEAGSTFECKLDGGIWEACDSGSMSYTDVADGEHTFYVRATDAASNTDPTPASHTWTIDTTPPDTTIDTAPADPSNSSDATFTFSSESGATFDCRLDGGAWVACDSGTKTYSALADGEHTFEVRATDLANNTDPTPVAHIWTIDTAAGYAFSGFYAPVDNPPILNVVKAGSAVPVKFTLGGDYGLDIFAAGYPASRVVACSTGTGTDPIETTVSAGGSSLQYDPLTGVYTYVWKTAKNWSNCRELILRFDDGMEVTALFRFR